MTRSRLGRLQQDLLEAFFRHETRFFLSGGAALAGFHLGHRETDDLDLFTTEDVMEQGRLALAEAARELGATREEIQTAPDFQRYLVRRGPESLVVDLVRDRVPQMIPEKTVIGGIRLDPPEEILANKLCALLSRAELRDLVDVRALEQAGFRVEDALEAAARKDKGLTAGQLAWVLSQITIGDDARPPGAAAVAELRGYLRELVARLSTMSFPKS